MKGSCLCGGVVYEIDPPFKIFQYCHCSRCRKFTGSAHAANLFVPPNFVGLRAKSNWEGLSIQRQNTLQRVFAKNVVHQRLGRFKVV